MVNNVKIRIEELKQILNIKIISKGKSLVRVSRRRHSAKNTIIRSHQLSSDDMERVDKEVLLDAALINFCKVALHNIILNKRVCD